MHTYRGLRLSGAILEGSCAVEKVSFEHQQHAEADPDEEHGHHRMVRARTMPTMMTYCTTTTAAKTALLGTTKRPWMRSTGGGLMNTMMPTHAMYAASPSPRMGSITDCTPRCLQ